MLSFKKLCYKPPQVFRGWLNRLKSEPGSADYLAWRHQFLQKRLRLGLWLALFWHLVASAEGLYSVLFEFERLKAFVLSSFRDAAIADQLRAASIFYYIGVNLLLLACLQQLLLE